MERVPPLITSVLFELTALLPRIVEAASTSTLPVSYTHLTLPTKRIV